MLSSKLADSTEGTSNRVPLHDDLGDLVIVQGNVSRIVSLVPSLTESIALTNPESLIGATDWCIHPSDLAVQRIRGTKNPDWKAIVELKPDLVLANMEENREIDVRRLRTAGIPVWVTHIETVQQGFESITRIFSEALRWDTPAWLTHAQEIWSHPVTPRGIRVAVPIWKDPRLVVGSSTFAGDILNRLGIKNAFADRPDQYPKVTLDEIDRDDIGLILLPDEPYLFTAEEGLSAFNNVATSLISGRYLTWYGPSLIDAHRELSKTIATFVDKR